MYPHRPPTRHVADALETARLKALLRTSMQQRLNGLPHEAFVAAGKHLLERFRGIPFSEDTGVFLFASMHGEIDTWPLLAWAWRSSRDVALPRVERRRMTFHAVTGRSDLERGVFGIMQPGPHCPVRDLSDSSLVLVPGLAFSRDGARLGRGGGYYDRFLTDRPPGSRAIGVCLDVQVSDDIPVAGHDQRVDEVWILSSVA